MLYAKTTIIINFTKISINNETDFCNVRPSCWACVAANAQETDTVKVCGWQRLGTGALPGNSRTAKW